MANGGTGLPIPKSGDVRTQPMNVIDADRYSSARDWGNIAAAGAKIASDAERVVRLEEHQQQVGYLAEQDTEIARRRIDMRDEFAHNPQGFDAAWKGYSDGKLAEAQPWAVPHLRKVLSSSGNDAYSVILGERRSRDQRLAREKIGTLATSAGNEVIGAGTAGTLNTPDGLIKIENYRNVLQSAVTAGLHTQEWADYHLDDTISKATGEEAARSGVQVYRERGFDAAVDHLRKNILENEGLSLKPEARYRAFSHGMQQIRLERAQDQQDRAGIVQESRYLRARIDSGQAYDAAEVRDTAAALARVGAMAEHRSLIVADAVKGTTRGASLPELRDAAVGRRAAGGPRANEAMQFFQSRGYTPAQAAGIVGNLIQESGGNLDPTLSHDQGTGIGIAGWRLERRQALRQFAAARGKTETDFQTQLEFLDHELKTSPSESRARDELSRARTPAEAARAMIHFERPAGYTQDRPEAGHGFSNRVRNAQSLAGERGGFDAEGTGYDYERAKAAGMGPSTESGENQGHWGSVAPATEAEKRALGLPQESYVLLKGRSHETWDKAVQGEQERGFQIVKRQGRYYSVPADAQIPPDQPQQRQNPYAGEIAKQTQGALVRSAREAWPQFRSLIDRGQSIDGEDFEAIRTAAALSGDQKWQQEVESAAVASRIGRTIEALPEGERQAAVDRMRVELQASGLPEVAQDLIQRSVTQQFERLNKMVREDPVDFAIERGAPAPAPLDFSSPQALQAGVSQRVAMARGVAADQQVPAGSPFRSAERAAIAGAIGSTDPKRAQIALDAIAGLPDEMLTPALASPDIKAAVTGAARSNDPARFNAAMQFMDRMWGRAPETTKALFGDDAIHQLMTWQSSLRYLTPEAQAKERERLSLDPQVRARMKVNEDVGRDIARRDYKFDQIVSQFDTSWWITPGVVARNITGTQPLPPIDPLARNALMGDFETVFARRYAETLDKDKALEETVKLLKTKWQPSPINGGRLMLNGPETLRDSRGDPIYPAIKGSWDWAQRQIEADIGRELGRPMIEDDPTGVAPSRNWSYSLIADRQTQAEAQAGRPASYLVQVIDAATGRPTILPRRFAFDPTEAVEKRRTEFETERRRVLQQRDNLRDTLLGSGSEFPDIRIPQAP